MPYAVYARHPHAAILLLGPGGHIPPSWMNDRSQALTRNYASGQYMVESKFKDQPSKLKGDLQELADTLEHGWSGAWHIEEMGSRYERLSRRIVSFVVCIRETRAKYKLGRDENDDIFECICRGVAARGGDALLAWMAQFN